MSCRRSRWTCRRNWSTTSDCTGMKRNLSALQMLCARMQETARSARHHRRHARKEGDSMTTIDEAHEAVRTLLAYIEEKTPSTGGSFLTRPSEWLNRGPNFRRLQDGCFGLASRPPSTPRDTTVSFSCETLNSPHRANTIPTVPRSRTLHTSRSRANCWHQQTGQNIGTSRTTVAESRTDHARHC